MYASSSSRAAKVRRLPSTSSSARHSAPVLAMVSADVVVEDGAFDALLRHFDDPAVGMAGGHPIPVNGDATFLGHAVQLAVASA